MMLMNIEMDAICGGTILFLIGLAVMFNGIQMYLTMRKVQNTPTSKIRSVAMGLAEVYGKANSYVEKISPFSNEKCSYYKIQVQAYIEARNKDESSTWRTIFTKQLNDVFKLTDDTGTINVNPKGAETLLDIAKAKEGNITNKLLSLRGVEQEIVDFINKLTPEEQKIINRYRRHRIKVNEWRILENEKVYVLGSVEPSMENTDIKTIKKGGEKIMFLSNKEEIEIVSKLRMGVIFRLVGGLAVSTIVMIFMFVEMGIF
jgi:hypothetical protein